MRTQYTSFDVGGWETHVVYRVPSQPSCDLAVWLPRGQPDLQHLQPPPFPLPIVRDSCFDSGSGSTMNLVAAGRAIGCGSRGRCKWDHHRTLLKQVHLLCFHAYCGFAL